MDVLIPHALRRLSGIAFVAFLLSGALAQTGSSDQPFDFEGLEPVTGSEVDEKPQFRFALVAELPLPGPLPTSESYLLDQAIAIEVAGGVALITWDGEQELLPSGSAPAPETAEDPMVALSQDGRVRCFPVPEGWIRTERRCGSCAKVWRKKWKVRAPGSEFARPLVTDKRVYYGATDNRVYSVKRRNGYRVWATDVGGRVIRALGLLHVPAPPDTRFIGPRGSRLMELVLVLPDNGEALVALAGRSGEIVARYDLPENEAFVGAPVTHGSKVAVVRQRYDARDAAMLIFELQPPLPPPATDADLAAARTSADPSGEPAEATIEPD